jgi:hypothetical protein
MTPLAAVNASTEAIYFVKAVSFSAWASWLSGDIHNDPGGNIKMSLSQNRGTNSPHTSHCLSFSLTGLGLTHSQQPHIFISPRAVIPQQISADGEFILREVLQR